MTRINEKDLQGLLINLKGLVGVDPILTSRIDEAIRRVYEILLLKINNVRKEIESDIDTKISANKTELNSLIGGLSQPLTGSKTTDPVLQSVASLPLTKENLPSDLTATKLNADGIILDINSILDGEYLRRIGNTVISGVPVGTTTLAEGTLPNVEGILYTTPAGHRTRIRHVLLFNNSAGILNADVLAKDPSNNIIYNNNNENLNPQQKVVLNPNIILPANYTFRGFTSAIGAIEYTIFGVEEPL